MRVHAAGPIPDGPRQVRRAAATTTGIPDTTVRQAVAVTPAKDRAAVLIRDGPLPAHLGAAMGEVITAAATMEAAIMAADRMVEVIQAEARAAVIPAAEAVHAAAPAEATITTDFHPRLIPPHSPSGGSARGLLPTTRKAEERMRAVFAASAPARKHAGTLVYRDSGIKL